MKNLAVISCCSVTSHEWQCLGKVKNWKSKDRICIKNKIKCTSWDHEIMTIWQRHSKILKSFEMAHSSEGGSTDSYFEPPLIYDVWGADTKKLLLVNSTENLV